MKRYLRIISLVICFLLIFSISSNTKTYAYEVEEMSAKGIVETENSDLRVRSGPGTEYQVLTTLTKGTLLEICGKLKNSSGALWYKVKANGFEGFAHSDYVKIIEIPDTPDADFQLVLENFPESYHEKLKVVHALHPSWKFTPLKTNISWDTLMKNECIIGTNLLQSPNAWKSFEDGAYNWKTNSWYSFDSGGWSQACIEVIGYYLDPRNFFDDDIYQFLVLSNDGSIVDKEAIESLFDGTFMHKKSCVLESEKTEDPDYDMTYAEAFIRAGAEAGVSPYLLAARIRQEQGAKGNSLAHGSVEGHGGWYNFFNIGAYAHSGRSAVVNGAIYAEKKGWNTPYKAILGGAQFLANGYINVGQNTLYLQKYDVVDGGNGFYSHQYMTNVAAAKSECATLRKAIQGTSAEKSQLNFLIPVYENMPEESYTLPLTTGNANNLLTSIKVEGARMPSEFDKYTYQYEAFTDSPQVTVSAVASNAEAKIEGTGIVNLKEGINEHVITVTATNGLVRKYVIYITTNANEELSFATEYPYTDTRITGVSANTSVEEFKKKFSSLGYTIGFYDSASNELKADEKVKTGDYVKLSYENLPDRIMHVVIKGDSNADGTLSSRDLLKTQKVILGINSFENELFREAADYTGDGVVNSRDLLACQKKILGLS